MSRKIITAAGAPDAVGPYSHAVSYNGLLFCSGQIALHPESGELVGSNAVEQAKQCLTNLEAVCAAAGTELAKAVKLTVYMADLADFAPVNEIYASFFPHDPPARVAFQAAGLPKGAQVEIDAIVALD
jgi:2-iminobutanoate/2-iminopropanoate deaminase